MTDKNETALQRTEPAGALVETFDDLVANAGKGTENIGADDVRPPRLMLCQSGTPQRKEGNSKYVKGLNELDLFNSLSNDNYGRQLDFVVVAYLGSNWVEFNSDLQVVDRDVKEGDPRTEWTEDKDGNRVKPIATKFYNYLVWLPEHASLMTLSFKSTQIKVAIKLNGLLKLPLKVGDKIIANPPAWARLYHLETKMENDKQYSWGAFNLATNGITPHDVRQMCAELAGMYAKLNVVIEHDETDAGEERVETADAGAHAGDASDM